jgi:hypothetical protein
LLTPSGRPFSIGERALDVDAAWPREVVGSMDAMRGLEEHREPTRLAGVENLMLHFKPYAEVTVSALAELERRIGAAS